MILSLHLKWLKSDGKTACTSVSRAERLRWGHYPDESQTVKRPLSIRPDVTHPSIVRHNNATDALIIPVRFAGATTARASRRHCGAALQHGHRRTQIAGRPPRCSKSPRGLLKAGRGLLNQKPKHNQNHCESNIAAA
jgi:hypothetical protein